MKRSEQFVLLSLLTALACAGCIPEEGPVYLSDGRTVVTYAEDETGKSAMWTYDLLSKTIKAYPPPTNWNLSASRAFSNQIWVQFQCQHEADPRTRRSSYWEYTCKRFDPLKDQFPDGPQELESLSWLESAVPASYENRHCLFFSHTNDEFDVFSFPELMRIKTLHLAGSVIAAGNFWWLQITTENIDVFDPHAKKVCTIHRSDIAKVFAGRMLNYARITEDGKAVLIVDGNYNGIDGFAVFDTGTGKFLWGYEGNPCFIWGTPLVKSSEIWTMEMIGKKKEVPATDPSAPPRSEMVLHPGLVRYSPGTTPDEEKATREEIMVFPIEMVGRNPHFDDQFTVSPDGSHFAMVINGKPSKLLFIPIKKGITEKDVEVVELRETKSAP